MDASHTHLNPAHWPRLEGAYVLLIEVSAPLEIIAGRYGSCAFTPGIYAYVGSAHGPGGLRARLARHLRAEKKLHWHIDYLLAAGAAHIIGVYARSSAERQECAWVHALIASCGAAAAFPRFGASDCRGGCPAHLLRLPAPPDLARLEETLRYGET